MAAQQYALLTTAQNRLPDTQRQWLAAGEHWPVAIDLYIATQHNRISDEHGDHYETVLNVYTAKKRLCDLPLPEHIIHLAVLGITITIRAARMDATGRPVASLVEVTNTRQLFEDSLT